MKEIAPTIKFPLCIFACGPAKELVFLFKEKTFRRNLLAHAGSPHAGPSIVLIDISDTQLEHAASNIEGAIGKHSLHISAGRSTYNDDIAFLEASIDDTLLTRHSFLRDFAQTTLMSFFLHWAGGGRNPGESTEAFKFRTKKLKHDVLRVVFDIAKHGALGIHCEEFDLMAGGRVVDPYKKDATLDPSIFESLDSLNDEQFVRLLPGLIASLTSPLTVPELSLILTTPFVNSGSFYQTNPAVSLDIDGRHRMYRFQTTANKSAFSI